MSRLMTVEGAPGRGRQSVSAVALGLSASPASGPFLSVRCSLSASAFVFDRLVLTSCSPRLAGGRQSGDQSSRQR